MKVQALFVAAALVGAATAAYAQGPTDPQIASIVVTANQVDIAAGRLAKTKTANKEVSAFAQQMITDHTGVNKQATALVTKLKVKPEDNPTSQSLKSGGDKNVAALKALKGAEFDRAYINHEVDYHLPPTHEASDRYYVVFRRVGASPIRSVEADFTLSFGY